MKSWTIVIIRTKVKEHASIIKFTYTDDKNAINIYIIILCIQNHCLYVFGFWF